jgi:ferredoxin
MNFPFYPAGIPSSLPKSTSPYFNGFFFTICRKFFSCSLKKSYKNPLSQYLQGVFTSERNFPMNVSIDRGACVSCGACWNICPELFNQNPCDSYSEVIDNYRFNGDRSEGIVPEYLGCCAQEAADLCPVQIIRVC